MKKPSLLATRHPFEKRGTGDGDLGDRTYSRQIRTTRAESDGFYRPE